MRILIHITILGILKLDKIIKLQVWSFVIQIRNNGSDIPDIFSDFLEQIQSIYNTRYAAKYTRYAAKDNYYRRPKVKTNYGKFIFIQILCFSVESIPFIFPLIRVLKKIVNAICWPIKTRYLEWQYIYRIKY